MRWTTGLLVILASFTIEADEPGYVMTVGGEPWLKTITPEYDDSTDEMRQNTNKVYTQIYDFDGGYFVTKGLGGKYPHHRGMFIGWSETKIGDKTYNTWVQPDNYQAHVEWVEQDNGFESAWASQIIEWRDGETDSAFIREERSIEARAGRKGVRIFDFTSILTALTSDIALRGDLQHAGMQVRLANEVSEHEKTTEYILPKEAEEREGDEVVGGWWAMCSAMVEGKRVWIMHMTPPDHLAGEPVYSIRRYARFGSFTQPDLKKGEPLKLTYRVVMSSEKLDHADCNALYKQYTKERNN